MDFLKDPLTYLLEWAPSLLAGTLGVLGYILVRRWLERDRRASSTYAFRNQAILVSLGFLILIVLILTVPIGDSRRGQILNLVGLLLTAAIALSSTTILGNGMAGIMLRAVRGFHIGDFILCGAHFGRVSEQGLFHTEIQTPDRELVTLPNLHLITHPVTTIRSSGTVVSSTVSLGYDAPRQVVEPLLIEAAEAAGLEDPFVQVTDLGDFSVTYRVAGLLKKVSRVITIRSRLKKRMIDRLHAGGVEIVSPTFMNQRVYDTGTSFIARPVRVDPSTEAADAAPESLVFDKAEVAATLETLRAGHDKLLKAIAALDEEIKKTPEEGRAPLETKREGLERRRESVAKLIEKRQHEAE